MRDHAQELLGAPSEAMQTITFRNDGLFQTFPARDIVLPSGLSAPPVAADNSRSADRLLYGEIVERLLIFSTP